MPENEPLLEQLSYHRIDSSVQPYSYWQAIFIGLFVLAICIIALVVSLSWWIVLMVLLTIIAALAVIYTEPKLLIHMTSPALYHLNETHSGSSRGKWQLLWQTASRQELWEAKLIQCRRYGRCVQLSFLVSHPMPVKLTQLIWQDQVSIDTWRRLSALARW